jgi:hypothetical protein
VWSAPPWDTVSAITIAAFRPEGTEHRPHTEVKCAWTPEAVHLLFRVDDRFVVATETGFGGEVYRDSCVEAFLQPHGAGPYFNFEVNCIGGWLCRRIDDSSRTGETFARSSLLEPWQVAAVGIHHTLCGPVTGELPGPLQWMVELAIPLSVLEAHVGPLRPLPGAHWHGNFYKCADASSHPHWGSWAPVGARDFHRPQDFGELIFAAS